MNKEAFQMGFIKAALNNGVDLSTATQMLKQANSVIDSLSNNLGIVDPAKLQALQFGMAGDAVGGAGIGAAGGALAGGLTGYLGGRNKEHPEQSHSMRDMALLGLLGGAAGGVGGGLTGGMVGGKSVSDYLSAHPRVINPH